MHILITVNPLYPKIVFLGGGTVVKIRATLDDRYSYEVCVGNGVDAELLFKGIQSECARVVCGIASGQITEIDQFGTKS